MFAQADLPFEFGLSDRQACAEQDRQISLAGTFRDVTAKPFNGDRSALRILNQKIATEDHHVVSLPVHRLNATQPHVNDNYRMVPYRYLAGDEKCLPAVVKYEGHFYVVDGHHRIMERVSVGQAIVRVRLFDLDGDTKTEFPLLDLA